MRIITVATTLLSLTAFAAAQGPAPLPTGAALPDIDGLLSDLSLSPGSNMSSQLELNLPLMPTGPELHAAPPPNSRLSRITREEREVTALQAEMNVSEQQMMDMDWVVNINTAPVGVLSAMPMIGTLRAEAIVDFREANGEFERTTDIVEVFGITQAIHAQLEDHLICEGQSTILAALQGGIQTSTRGRR